MAQHASSVTRASTRQADSLGLSRQNSIKSNNVPAQKPQPTHQPAKPYVPPRQISAVPRNIPQTQKPLSAKPESKGKLQAKLGPELEEEDEYSGDEDIEGDYGDEEGEEEYEDEQEELEDEEDEDEGESQPSSSKGTIPASQEGLLFLNTAK